MNTHRFTIRVHVVALLLLVSLLVGAGCAGLPMSETLAPELGVQTAVTPESTVVDVPTPPERGAISLVADQEFLADLYERVAPAVVNIQVSGSATGATPQLPPDFPFDLPGFPGLPQLPLQGEGSGFIYDTSGHILTNNHVIENADSVIVTFYDGRWAEATVLAADAQSDLAILKLEAPAGLELRPLPLAEPDSLRVGHTVIAIGNPFGLESTMTSGIVSAIGRSFPIGDAAGGNYTLPAVIQTDAAINPGNSGGPLLNLNGEVVGVNFAIESPVRASAGVGFAIPVSIVQRVAPALIAEGQYRYPYLGLSGGTITPDLARAMDLGNDVLGAYVESVAPSGPSDQAGVRGGSRAVQVQGRTLRAGGDIIIAIDEAAVRSFDDLVSYLVTRTSPGQEVTLTVLREGGTLTLSVRLGERPATAAPAISPEQGGISARAAAAIARDVVMERELLQGAIVETVIVQDEVDGQPVWAVELGDGQRTARVVVDAINGEVLDVSTR